MLDPDEVEPALHLSRYLRLFQDGRRGYVDALLSEQYLPLDPVLLGVVRALSARPLGFDSLARAVEASGSPCPPGELMRCLVMLRDAGLLLDDGQSEADALAAALSVASQEPVVDQVELTTACPMRCPMCARGTGELAREVGFIDRELFARLIDEIAPAQRDAKALGLHNLGESLLHPELDELIRIAARAGVRTDLSVNPGLLDLPRYLRLRDAGLSRLTLSLDGLDPATLEAVRGRGARGSQALENLQALLAFRREQPDEHPRIVLQMLRLRLNAHQHAAFLEQFGAPGLPGVTGCLKDLDANTPRGLFADGTTPQSTLCRAPWRTVVVLWDGRVVPCCYDGNAERVLGDLRRQSLREIWHGPELARLRAELRDTPASVAGPCARCAHRPDRFERPALDRIPQEPWTW